MVAPPLAGGVATLCLVCFQRFDGDQTFCKLMAEEK
jgi:hypothetical protein